MWALLRALLFIKTGESWMTLAVPAELEEGSPEMLPSASCDKSIKSQ